MIEEHLENHSHEGEEEHMHTHVLMMGLLSCIPMENTDIITVMHRPRLCTEPPFPGNRAPGIHQTHGGGRPGL